MTLYDIDKAIMDFEFEIDEETGEILNADELDNLHMEREQKIENIALYVKNLEAEKAAVKGEKDNMALREKRLGKKIDSLKNYLGYALKGERFNTPRVVVSYRKSESINIPDDALVEDKYCNISVIRRPDKTVIKDAIRKGEDVHGAELVVKTNVLVK